MKKITQTLTTACMAVLLFSIGTANAQQVTYGDPDDAAKITGITALKVNSKTYDISFVLNPASNFYGAYPGTYIFTEVETQDAVAALNALLTSESAVSIGADGSTAFTTFNIGFEGVLDDPNNTEYCKLKGGIKSGANWVSDTSDPVLYNADPRNYAVFVESGLGINDTLLGGVSVSVFPNPADNYIQIETQANIKSISIFNITGKKIQNLQFDGIQSTRLDIDKFNAGLYLLKLEDDKGHASIKKIVIQ